MVVKKEEEAPTMVAPKEEPAEEPESATQASPLTGAGEPTDEPESAPQASPPVGAGEPRDEPESAAQASPPAGAGEPADEPDSAAQASPPPGAGVGLEASPADSAAEADDEGGDEAAEEAANRPHQPFNALLHPGPDAVAPMDPRRIRGLGLRPKGMARPPH